MTAPEDTALTEQKRIMVDLHALHRRAYITPRRQERLRGAASRVSVPSPREPLPWLPGRATPPPLIPAPPPPPSAPVEASAAVEMSAQHVDEPPRPRSPWSLESSIWAPRRKWGDGKSFYDSDVQLARAMACDWQRAIEDGLIKHITRDYDGDAPSQDRQSSETEEVKDALSARARLIYSMFDFYASLGSSGDFTSIGFNAYKQLVADGGFAIDRSKHCDDSHLDQLFVQVNSAGAVAAAAAARASGIKQQGARAFARSETLHMLVRVAIARYILDGAETDVSQAVCRLCDHLEMRLVPQARQSADDFRRQCCYTEAVSDVLHTHRRSLRAVFEVYADFPNLKPPDAKLLAVDDWNLLLRHLEFFDEAFQQREGVLCFVFSRLRVIDEESERGKRKLRHLSFEDFLEGLVRASTMKALPTTSELLRANVSDAGLFLVELRGNPAAYATFVEARERAWDAPLQQPIERCVEHLVSLIIRTVDASIGRASHEARGISKSEVMRFHRQGGARTSEARSSTVQRGAVNSSWNPLAVLAQAKAMQAAAGAERKSSIGIRKGWAAVGIGLARAKE